VIVLALAFVLAQSLHGAVGDERPLASDPIAAERVVLWPFGTGFAPYELRSTYGQAEGVAHHMHRGLDVSDRRVGTGVRLRPVFALEDGVVVRVHEDPGNYVSGMVVESNAKPGRAWLYLHLEKGTLRFAEGEEVYKDQILGDSLLVDTVTNVPHLHLSRIGGDFATHDWNTVTDLNERNPLALFRPDILGDATSPTIEVIDGESLRFRSNEGSASMSVFSSGSIPASTAADVRACVHDQDGGSSTKLGPYKLELTIQGDETRSWRLCLDGPLPEPRTLYEDVKRGPGEYDVYFVLTNGAEDWGTAPAVANAWEASPGPNTIELKVSDVAGHEATVTTVIDALPP
jgi:peptidase M23-like protein